MTTEKINVAYKSVIAAVFLTVLKLIVGITTGSLGIISEAIHSSLDFIAAFITLFAVKVSDKPADEKHTFGHGKVENLSALIETIILIITCAWIIYEAFHRLISENYIVKVNIYSFLVMIICIIVDISRYISLNKAAKKHNSQALRADALHFISDVFSSFVVIIGLIFAYFGYKIADPIAAIGVSIMILVATYRLGKDTIEALLDTAPIGIKERIKSIVESTEDILICDKIRVRPSGPFLFINISIGLNKHKNHKDIYNIVHKIKHKLYENYPNSDISICTFPVEESDYTSNNNILNNIKNICYDINGIKNAHNIKILNIEDKKHVSLHVEAEHNINLKETHKLSHELKDKIINELKDIHDVSVHFQHSYSSFINVEDKTNDMEFINEIKNLVHNTINNCFCDDVKIYEQNGKYLIFLTCKLNSFTKLNQIQNISYKISNSLKQSFDTIEDVYIHFEPENAHDF